MMRFVRLFINQCWRATHYIMSELKTEDENEVIEEPLTYREAMNTAREWYKEKGRSVFNCVNESQDQDAKRMLAIFAHDLHERGLLNRGSAINPL